MTTTADFEACVTANRNRWINAARRFMPRQDAEDITSEAIMKAWRGLDTFRGECALSTWIGRILRRLIIDQHRLVKNNAQHVPLWGEDEIALRFLPENVTRQLLFREVLRLVNLRRIATCERVAILNLIYRTQPDVTKIRNDRRRGILKLRRMMRVERMQMAEGS